MSMTWKGNALTTALARALGAATRANAVNLAGEAAMQAPIELGELRGSGEPGATDGLWSEEAGGLNMTVGSNLSYAGVQHEDLSLRHSGPEHGNVDGGKAKYLEDPLNANRERYIQHLADAAREVLSG